MFAQYIWGFLGTCLSVHTSSCFLWTVSLHSLGYLLPPSSIFPVVLHGRHPPCSFIFSQHYSGTTACVTGFMDSLVLIKGISTQDSTGINLKLNIRLHHPKIQNPWKIPVTWKYFLFFGHTHTRDFVLSSLAVRLCSSKFLITFFLKISFIYFTDRDHK